MWSLEYEVDGLQSKFSESIGTLDLDNLDVDFIEDMMLKAKPLQSVLNDIRVRQNAKLAEVKKTYGEAIKELEVLVVERPAKGLGEEVTDDLVKPVETGEDTPAPPPPAEEAEQAPPPAAAEEWNIFTFINQINILFTKFDL